MLVVYIAEVFTARHVKGCGHGLLDSQEFEGTNAKAVENAAFRWARKRMKTLNTSIAQVRKQGERNKAVC